MKKKLPASYSLFLVIVLAVLFLSNNNNPPNGYTGAPPSGQTCSNCHGGGSASGNVVITGLPATITPDQIYPITVTVTRTTATPQKAGFQMTVLNGSNNFAGSFSTPSTGATVQTSAGISYFEHNPGQSFGAGNTINFTVNWRAPATGSGPITMYAAANLANGNNNNNGDYITTTTANGTLEGMGGTINVNIATTQVSCSGGSDGSATASAGGGGGGPYSYLWSNGSMEQSISGLTAGSYTVTVTNATGGMGTATATIIAPPQLNATITASGNISCATATGFATVQASGGTPNYTYLWSTGATTATATFSAAATYTVTVTDFNGCTKVASVNITANTTPPTATAGPDRTLSCTNPTVTLNGTGSSTGGNITYQWNGPGIVSGGATLMPVVNLAGTYTLTVTNQTNGCSATDQAVVSGNTTPPVANAGPDKVITCANLTVTLNGENSSAGANITYQWSGPGIVSGATTTTPVVNMAGTYILTVTNQSNNCTAVDQAVVTANTAPPGANAGADMALTCASPSVILNGTGSSSGANITYAWSGAGIVSGGNTATPVVNVADTYTLTVTNQTNGCSATDQVVVSSSIVPPAASAGPDQALTCTAAVVTLDGSGSASGPNITYDWGGPGIVSGGTTATPSVNAEGTYILTVTNQTTGCNATSQVAVANNMTLPVANAGPDTLIVCGNTTVVLNGTGSASGAGITYAWNGPGIVSGGATATPTVNAAGAYTLTVSNQANGCVSTDQVHVTINTALSIAVQVTAADCFGNSTGTATALASGGNGNYTYLWSTGATTAQISGLSAGTYSVTATNSNCTASGSATVTQPTALVVNVSTVPETAAGAEDGTAVATVTGGTPAYAFTWNTGAMADSIGNLAPGTYSVTVTDINGCTASATGEVNSSICTGFDLELEAVSLICHSDSSGSVAATVTGGIAPFSFTWSNGSTTPEISELPAGVYSVTATDGNNCVLTATTALQEPSVLMLTLQKTDVSCPGDSTGALLVSAAGGTPDYDFSWNTGDTTATLSQLGAGDYTVVVTDANGCSETAGSTIALLPDLTPPVVVTQPVTVYLDAAGIAEITPEMANNGSLDNCGIVNLELSQRRFLCDETGPQTVTLTATDAAGNETQATLTVTVLDTVPPSIVCPFSLTLLSCNQEVEYGLPVATELCDTIPVPVSVELISGLPSGSTFPFGFTQLTFQATDASGNSAVCSFSVNIVEPAPPATATANPFCAGSADGSVTVVTFGDPEGYTFVWDDPQQQTGAMAVGLSAGEYSVIVSGNSNGCVDTLSFVLQDPAPVQIELDELVSEFNTTMNGAISVTASGGDGSYTFIWRFNGQVFSIDQDLTGLSSGEYLLTVVDLNGCVATDTFFVDRIVNTPNPALDYRLRLFPNPASDQLTLEIAGEQAANLEVALMDFDGRLLQQPVHALAASHIFHLDVSDCTPGVYLVRIIVGDQVLWKKAVVER